MGQVRVVTDSTSSIPRELAEKYHIEVVPLRVLFGNEAFAEDIDISKDEFYARLKQAKELPRTSQPSAGEFAAVYERLGREADGIISIHISSKLSGTFASAEAARAMLPGLKLNVIDSGVVSMALGLLVLRAAEAAAEGRSLDEVTALVETLRPRMRVSFVVDTLEFLQKGGRIGGAAALVGSLLHVKPILTLRDGRVEPLERVRTKRRAVERLIHLLKEETKAGGRLHIAVLHGQAPKEAEALVQRLCETFGLDEIHIGEVGPVIATHTGPGVVGVAYYVE